MLALFAPGDKNLLLLRNGPTLFSCVFSGSSKRRLLRRKSSSSNVRGRRQKLVSPLLPSALSQSTTKRSAIFLSDSPPFSCSFSQQAANNVDPCAAHATNTTRIKFARIVCVMMNPPLIWITLMMALSCLVRVMQMCGKSKHTSYSP